MAQETQEQGSGNIIMVLGVVVVVAALIGAGYMFVQLQNANQAEATAIANEQNAIEAALTATVAQGQAINEAEAALFAQEQAEDSEATAIAMQAQAEDSAATAMAEATESAGVAGTADANAVTATVAQGEAEDSEATAIAQATDSAGVAETAIADADTAIIAQGDAEAEATEAVMMAATSDANAITATIAQGEAENSEATAIAQATESAGIAETAIADAESAIAAQSTLDAELEAERDVVSDLEATVDAQNELLAAADEDDDDDTDGADDDTTTFVSVIDISLDDLEDEDFDIAPYSLASLEIPDFTLFSEEDGFIEVKALGITIADFMIDITVTNPDVSGYWDYGFLFRMDGEGEYRITIDDDGDWSLILRDGSDFNTLDEGSLSSFDDDDGEENRLRLITAGDEGLLVVNDQVIELDLSDKKAAGDIFISIEIGDSFSEENTPVDMSDAVLWAIGVPGDDILDDDVAEGELTSRSEVDEWWYRGSAGDVIDIQTSSDDNVDTRLVIYDSYGAVVRLNDNADNSESSLVEAFILPSTGYYRILIDSPSGDRGAYTIEVSESDFAIVDPLDIDEDSASAQIDIWEDGGILYELDDIDLDHDTENGFIETFRLEEGIANFLIEATIYNPYDVEDEDSNWDYGFLFRDGMTQEYYLIFEPFGRWELWLRVSNTELDIFESTRIDAGFVSDWDNDAGDDNDILLGVYNNVGILFVNGDFVTVLDLSDNVMPGDLELVTGFDINAEIDGEETFFEDVTVWDVESAEELGFPED